MPPFWEVCTKNKVSSTQSVPFSPPFLNGASRFIEADHCGSFDRILWCDFESDHVWCCLPANATWGGESAPRGFFQSFVFWKKNTTGGVGRKMSSSKNKETKRGSYLAGVMAIPICIYLLLICPKNKTCWAKRPRMEGSTYRAECAESTDQSEKTPFWVPVQSFHQYCASDSTVQVHHVHYVMFDSFKISFSLNYISKWHWVATGSYKENPQRLCFLFGLSLIHGTPSPRTVVVEAMNRNIMEVLGIVQKKEKTGTSTFTSLEERKKKRRRTIGPFLFFWESERRNKTGVCIAQAEFAWGCW